MNKKIKFLVTLSVFSTLVSCSNDTSSTSYISSSTSSPSSITTSSSENKITSINYKSKKITLDDHNIYINMRLDSSKLNEYVYNSLLKANESIKDTPSSEDNPINFYIDKGVYWVDDKDAKEDLVGKPNVGLEVDKEYVNFLGMDNNPKNIVIAGNRGKEQGSTLYWNTMSANTGFVCKDITIGNYVNVDLDYEDDPSLSVKMRNSTSITQGQTILAKDGNVDKWSFDNVRFISRLNTIPGKTFDSVCKRVYIKNSHIELTDDGIQPGDNVVYENCNFDFYGKHPMWGYKDEHITFFNSTFNNKADNSTFYFSKDFTNIALIDSKFVGDYSKGIEWVNDIETHPTLRNYIYNTTYNNSPVEISPSSLKNTVNLKDSDKMLLSYKVNDIYNSYNLLQGNDNWDPNNVKEKIQENSSIPYMIEITSSNNKDTFNEGEEITLTPKFINSKTNNLDYEVKLVENTTIEKYTKLENGDLKLKIKDKIGLEKITDSLEISYKGLIGSYQFTIEPNLREAPTITNTNLSLENQKLLLNYDINYAENGLKDESQIDYYRSQDESLDKDDILIASTSLNDPLKEYKLTLDDVDSYIFAKIKAKSSLSNYGDETIVKYENKITDKDVSNPSIINPAVKNLPLDNSKIAEGTFSFDKHEPKDLKEKYFPDLSTGEDPNYTQYKQELALDTKGFSYIEGLDGAKGIYGLTNTGRSARMLYTPKQKQSNKMDLYLVIYPSKTHGQGFGYAKDYLDIYIGYDTSSLTGYSLRIERIKEAGDATLFSLYSFKNDVSTCLTTKTSTIGGKTIQGVLARAYRGKVDIKLSLSETSLKASVTSSIPNEEQADVNHQNKVELESNLVNDIKPSNGIGFIHTGSIMERNRSTIESFILEYK